MQMELSFRERKDEAGRLRRHEEILKDRVVWWRALPRQDGAEPRPHTESDHPIFFSLQNSLWWRL